MSDVRVDEIQTGEYDVTLCAGTIVYGKAEPAALDECVRHVRPGTVSSAQCRRMLQQRWKKWRVFVLARIHH